MSAMDSTSGGGAGAGGAGVGPSPLSSSSTPNVHSMQFDQKQQKEKTSYDDSKGIFTLPNGKEYKLTKLGGYEIPAGRPLNKAEIDLVMQICNKIFSEQKASESMKDLKEIKVTVSHSKSQAEQKDNKEIDAKDVVGPVSEVTVLGATGAAVYQTKFTEDESKTIMDLFKSAIEELSDNKTTGAANVTKTPDQLKEEDFEKECKKISDTIKRSKVPTGELALALIRIRELDAKDHKNGKTMIKNLNTEINSAVQALCKSPHMEKRTGALENLMLYDILGDSTRKINFNLNNDINNAREVLYYIILKAMTGPDGNAAKAAQTIYGPQGSENRSIRKGDGNFSDIWREFEKFLNENPSYKLADGKS